MTVPVLLAPNISNFQTFHSLALFICHLFVDGKFRTAHIVHDQNVFDPRLISEIHLNCFEPIPYVLTDAPDHLYYHGHLSNSLIIFSN